MAKVVILSGAGISAESGISTFRDSGGLWEEYDISVVCNYDSLVKHEDLTIEFYDKRRADIEDKEPNYAHKIIKELKDRYKHDIAVITQNVDNLFEKAGMCVEDVIHLHGFMPTVRCRDEECAKVYDIGYKALSSFNDGKCPECGTKLRPNIVFFGEAAPMYERLNAEIQDCQFFVVIGTSGNVIEVNSTAAFCDYAILNNLEASSAIAERDFDKVIYDKASNAIDIIADDIESFLQES